MRLCLDMNRGTSRIGTNKKNENKRKRLGRTNEKSKLTCTHCFFGHANACNDTFIAHKA